MEGKDMKRFFLMLLVAVSVSGCSSKLYQKDPDVSKHFVRREVRALDEKEVEKAREERKILMENFRDDSILLNEYPQLREEDESKRLKAAWRELIIIYDNKIRSKSTNEVDRIREVQYRNRIDRKRELLEREIRELERSEEV